VSGRETAIYNRGKYWLDWDRKADGSLRSPFLAIFWYDRDARRTRSASTGTAAEDAAMIALDRRYLADRGEAAAYCDSCGQPIARASAYLLTDSIADYRLEVGDERTSADSIEARLKHVLDYLEEKDLTEASCAQACAPLFIANFRAWSKLQPVVWRNGKGDITVSRPRSPATTEESVLQLCAVLNHAANEKRSDARPDYKPLPRKQVTAPRRVRVDAPVLADMLLYAAEPAKRRGALHAFLIAEICTLARPEAVVDISTTRDRRQWWPGSALLDLNPAGRTQTKKFRPIVPVVSVLGEWLDFTHANVAAESPRERTGGWLVNYYGKPVQDVESAWEKMLVALKLPLEREWRPYVIRHSIATLLRGAGVPLWELQGMMGHHAGGTTETYAIETRFANATKAIEDLLGELDVRAKGALHRRPTGPASNVIILGGQKMPAG
jgi:integrase